MQEEYYNKLPTPLKRYVDEKGWGDFREVQKKAFDVISDTDEHLLISAGTSSGKTEAALFPVIAEIYKDRPKRISALYISPLIALIDDQFERVSKMLELTTIDLFSWHGDISASLKKKVLEHEEGILQITPESLEGIVNRNFDKVKSLFSDLRYVIIDEVHSFMNSERGLHLLCELEAIERIAGCKPRRIGLSATLSDYSIAKDWLKANSKRDVSLIECGSDVTYDLTITFDNLATKDNKEERQASLRRKYEKIFDETNDYNCLIFANNRTSVENIVGSLKILNQSKGVRKDVYAHHSSVSKEFRKEAEEHLKNTSVKCTSVATSTLELGIDVGDLDRIIHINAPQSVSSFVQKMGRSGRRNGRPTMICHCDNEYKSKIPGVEMDLIKAIAETELYLGEKWVEPIQYSELPYNLLFQQTVGYVRSRIIASKVDLITNVLSMYPFRKITVDDYELMLDNMLKERVLDEASPPGHYCLGDTGDRLTRKMDFGSNFIAKKELEVVSGKQRIGTIQNIPSVGEMLQLSGNSWIVTDVSYNVIHVVPSAKMTETVWKSGSSDTHTRVVKKMYDCLMSNEQYPYLDDEAKAVLQSSRERFRELGLKEMLVTIDGVSCYFPWLGTKEFDTVGRILKKIGIGLIVRYPYSIVVKEGHSIDSIESAIEDYAETHDLSELIDDDDLNRIQLGKYDWYIPKELLIKEYSVDRLMLSIKEPPNL